MRLFNSQILVMVLCFISVCAGAEDQPLPDSDRSAAPRINLRNTFELIDKSSDMYGSGEPNSVATIRAVNHLHSFGKERAIAVLRSYLKYADAFGNRRESNMPNQERVSVIIPLLFNSSVADEPFPSLERHPWNPPNRESSLIHTPQWELHNLVVISDLPFNKERITVRGPPLPGREYLVEWAEKHGRLREKRLSPSDDPLKVADDICDAIVKETGSLNRYQRSRIRSQAWRSIQHLFPLDRENDEDDLGFDDLWQDLHAKMRKRAIRWSDQQQDYIAE